MKKIFAILLLVGGIFASCDMDKYPYGSLDDQTAIQKVNDVERFRNGLYSSMRSITSGAWVFYQDLQTDEFNGMIGNGNRGGNFATGNILSSDQDIESFFASMYSVINSANYLIERVQPLLDSEEFDEEQKLLLNLYKSEAHFLRAYCYYWMAEHFCNNIQFEGANGMGVQLVTAYFPTADRSKYPARSTQAETYALIDSDLEAANKGFQAYEAAGNTPEPNAHYFNTNTVLALQARMALTKGDYQVAYNKATQLINTDVYELTEGADYIDMWSTDEGSEVIFRPFMSNVELGSSTGQYYLTDSEQSADYIPTTSVLFMYGEGDIRFDAFFTVYTGLVANGITSPAFVFNKYPGNETLKTGAQRNFMNMTKPFRLSEAYLIAAEAAAELGDVTNGNKYLNALCKARIIGYEDANYPGETLLSAVREERQKELIGEGFRLSDLRRWKQGFARDAQYSLIGAPSLEDMVLPNCVAVTYQAGDYRYVWPIPTTEMQSNPKLEGQQNPGY